MEEEREWEETVATPAPARVRWLAEQAEARGQQRLPLPGVGARGGQAASPQAQRPALFVIDHGMATMTDGVARGSNTIAPDLTEVASRLGVDEVAR